MRLLIVECAFVICH